MQRTWLGAELVGEAYQLVNVSLNELTLAERDLYKPGVLALSLERHHLRAGEATALFVIRARGVEAP